MDNLGTSHKQILAWHLSHALECNFEEVWQCLEELSGAQIEKELRFSYTTSQKLTRLLCGPVLDTLPYSVYRPITDIIKKIKGRKTTFDKVQLATSEVNQALKPIYQKTPQKVTVCLTHDLDTHICYQFSREVAAMEKARGLRSTFNFLTQGPYQLEMAWLDRLEEDGFEIGLHGDYHDLAFGFRNKKQIAERLKKCRHHLQRPVLGYRAPALCISENLLQVLSDLGFRYDSSIRNVCYYSKGTPFGHSYPYPDIGLYELPLTIQDDGLFRDRNLNNQEALEVIKEVIDQSAMVSGLVVLNTHPCHLVTRVVFYQNLLRFLEETSWIEVKLMRDLLPPPLEE